VRKDKKRYLDAMKTALSVISVDKLTVENNLNKQVDKCRDTITAVAYFSVLVFLAVI